MTFSQNAISLREIFRKKMKILGMGNALVDVLATLKNDNLLKELNLPKGSMQLIDAGMRNTIFEKIKGLDTGIASGGSAGNTILALAKMGQQSGFIGKVGDDDYGRFYMDAIQSAGVKSHLITKQAPSGTAMTLISPDGERTFGTYLGVAAELTAEEIQAETFRPYNYFYIEGYLVQNYHLIETAVSVAKSMGIGVAIDLASYNIVEENREFLMKLIDQYVDIVFANEEEAKALTGTDAEKAVRILAAQTQIAVVKVGAEGSWIMQGENLIHVPVAKIQPVDATAAGDFYAAGFLYGMANQVSLEQCARLGSLLAGNVIQVIGTKLPEESWSQIRLKAGEILNESAQ